MSLAADCARECELAISPSPDADERGVLLPLTQVRMSNLAAALGEESTGADQAIAAAVIFERAFEILAAASPTSKGPYLSDLDAGFSFARGVASGEVGTAGSESLEDLATPPPPHPKPLKESVTRESEYVELADAATRLACSIAASFSRFSRSTRYQAP